MASNFKQPLVASTSKWSKPQKFAGSGLPCTYATMKQEITVTLTKDPEGLGMKLGYQRGKLLITRFQKLPGDRKGPAEVGLHDAAGWTARKKEGGGSA